MFKINIDKIESEKVNITITFGFNEIKSKLFKYKKFGDTHVIYYDIFKNCINEGRKCMLSNQSTDGEYFIFEYSDMKLKIPVKDYKDDIIKYIDNIIDIRIKYFNEAINVEVPKLSNFDSEVFPIMRIGSLSKVSFQFYYIKSFDDFEYSEMFGSIQETINDILKIYETNKDAKSFDVYGVSILTKYIPKVIESFKKYQLDSNNKYYCLGMSDEWQDF